MASTEQSKSKAEEHPGQDSNLELVLYAFIALGLVAIAVFVFLYGQRGESLIQDLATREPNAVMKEGIRHEWAGDLDGAVAAYRKALAMGFGDYWAEFGCKERLTNLLIQRGQLPELKLVGRAELDATDLLSNGGFEEGDGTLGWFPAGEDKAGVAIDPMEIIEGKRSLRIDLGRGAGPAVQNTVAVLPGRRYRVSGWMRVEGASPPGVRLGVRALEGDVGGFRAQGDRFLGRRDWQQVMFDFLAPADVARVAVALETGQDASGTVWLDQCALVRDEAGLLKNGSFETGENGRRFWMGTPRSGVEFSADPNVVLEGHQSFRIACAPGVGQTVWQNAAVEEGYSYELEVWLRTENLDGRGVSVGVKDAATAGGALRKTSSFVSGTRDWEAVRIGFVAPEGVYSVVVSVSRHNSGERAGGRVWIDACSLIRKQKGSRAKEEEPEPREGRTRLRKRGEKPVAGPTR